MAIYAILIGVMLIFVSLPPPPKHRITVLLSGVALVVLAIVPTPLKRLQLNGHGLDISFWGSAGQDAAPYDGVSAKSKIGQALNVVAPGFPPVFGGALAIVAFPIEAASTAKLVVCHLEQASSCLLVPRLEGDTTLPDQGKTTRSGQSAAADSRALTEPISRARIGIAGPEMRTKQAESRDAGATQPNTRGLRKHAKSVEGCDR